jgi:hypothetical protein
MLEKDIIWAEWLPRCEGKDMSRRGSLVVPKLYVFDGRQGTTCIAQEE